MISQTRSLLDAALSLSEAERWHLVERLLETLPPEADQVEDDKFFAELERRSAEIEQGQVKPIPWSNFRLDE